MDVQISLDGATAEVNDAVRGPGSYATAMRAMRNLADAGFGGFKLSVVMTRQNISQLDDFKAIADRFGAQLRITRLRPSGRGADVWHELHPLPEQQRELYDWLVAHGEDVLTGDSFFHLSAYGSALPGLNLCGAGRVVCLIDPVGDVYACPFAIHESFLAGNVRDGGGFQTVWRESALFRQLREPGDGGACKSCGHYDSCRGGCMAAKFFTGLPLDGPDPECVQGYGVTALTAVTPGAAPRPAAGPLAPDGPPGRRPRHHRQASVAASPRGDDPPVDPPAVCPRGDDPPVDPPAQGGCPPDTPPPGGTGTNRRPRALPPAGPGTSPLSTPGEPAQTAGPGPPACRPGDDPPRPSEQGL